MLRREQTLRWAPLLLGLAAASLGALALAGWWLDHTMIKSVFPWLTSMKANTAVGMLFCGSALAILSREKVAPPFRFWTKIMAAGVVALGALTLGEYLFGWRLGLDQWLFRVAVDPAAISQPGRMSPAAAFCFLLAGVALLAASQPLSMRLRRSMLEALGLAMIVVAGLALVSDVSAALLSSRRWNYTGMALHTAAGFMLLGLGLQALSRREGQLKWSLDVLTTCGFMAGIVSLLATAGISYYFSNQLQESAVWVSHTQEVLKEIGGVTAGVDSLASSQGSYTNAGRDGLLEQKALIKVDLHQRMDALRKLTTDNPRQKPRLDQLDPLLAQHIEGEQQNAAAQPQEGLSAAEQMIATGKRIEITESIRRLIKALENEEYALLDQRQKKERAIAGRIFLVLPLSAFISITFLSLGLFFLNTGLGERARTEEALLRAAQTLQETNVKLGMAKSAAEKANLAKSDFLSNMSHELRSPLNAILGFAQLLESASPAPTAAQTKSIRQILQAGWYLLKLINEILDLAGIESGQVSISKESVSLSELMSECQSMMEPQLQPHGIRMTFPRFDALVFVSADRTRLKQIIINLLSNAIKYNREKGTVVVDCTVSAPGRIRISVKDTGAGLSSEKLAQLFQPFNRLGQEAGKVAGTGIGLVVSKRLAELMGGVIGVNSKVGVGSEFWCELGAAEAPQLAIPGSDAEGLVQPEASVDAPKRTLLYVEDNPANLELVEELIARFPDIRLLTAVDGILGIDLARAEQPQVILMDINLPGISGIKALKILREDPATAHIPVIALSANAMASDIKKGLEAGFFRYLTKPIKIKELIDTLNTAMEFAEKTAGQSPQPEKIL